MLDVSATRQRIALQQVPYVPTPLARDEPEKCEPGGSDEGKGLEEAADTERDPRGGPAGPALRVVAKSEHEREREKDEESLGRVGQKRATVLVARVKSEEGQTSQISRFSILAKPTSEPEHRKRGGEGRKNDRDAEPQESPLLTPIGGEDAEPEKERRFGILETGRGRKWKQPTALRRQARDLDVGGFVTDVGDIEATERVNVHEDREQRHQGPQETLSRSLGPEAHSTRRASMGSTRVARRAGR